MSYAYYPGCALKGSAQAYEESLLAVFDALGESVREIDDWNCCGATAYSAVDENKAFALAARNLALAEAMVDGSGPVDVVAPCAGCYLVLLKTQRHLAGDGQRARSGLEAAGLSYQGRARVRHPLDVLVNDVGLERIADAVVRPLEGLRVACYYGCQIVRPYATFDDQHDPTSMDLLMRAIGAEPVDWPLKTRCCGAALVVSMPEVGLGLGRALLQEARRCADVLVTACPLCEFNLECYQDEMKRRFGGPVDLTVGFFTQLLGLALGLDERSLGIHRMLRWQLPLSRPVAPEGDVRAAV